MKRFLAATGVVLTLALGACNDQAGSTKSLSPIPPRTVALMSEKGMQKGDPILVRLYKKESELEIWKRVNGQYALLKTFPICRWSGQLGPKTREGDRQAPEGFYTVTPGLMNPNSAYYLSFDTGYPNAFDRSHNRTGSQLMVHGTCSSRGCYAMTDEGIAEVYALAREAFAGGQRGFQLQAYPFRMTAQNLARYRQDPNIAFWKNLKQGSDHFEVTRREPKVAVCEGRYAFNTVGESCKDDPTLAPTVAQKDDEDRRQVAELVAQGTPAVRLVYADGGGHESFRAEGTSAAGDAGSALAMMDARPRRQLGEVSRPDALAAGPREVMIEGPTKTATVRVAATAPASRTAPVSRTGAPTKIARTVLASADPDAPIAMATAPADRAAAPNSARRPGAAAKPAKPTEAGARPAGPKSKTAAAPARPSEKSRLLAGAQPTGPSATGFKIP